MTEKKKDISLEILPPKNQLRLFGYNKYFNSLAKLFKIGKLPNTILFSGQKGSGKATFAYHLSNYLLSDTENYKYDTVAHTIHSENKSYINLCNSTHPNFFLLENNTLVFSSGKHLRFFHRKNILFHRQIHVLQNHFDNL